MKFKITSIIVISIILGMLLNEAMNSANKANSRRLFIEIASDQIDLENFKKNPSEEMQKWVAQPGYLKSVKRFETERKRFISFTFLIRVLGLLAISYFSTVTILKITHNQQLKVEDAASGAL